MGADIAGACGQLVVSKENAPEQPTDIEDGPFQKKKITKTPSKMKKSRSIKSNNHNQSDKKDTGSIDNVEKWIRPLVIATGISASVFIISAVLIASNKRRSR